MRLLLATSNPHKLQEIQAVWDDLQRGVNVLPIELVGLNAVDPHRRIPEPVEDGQTFEANAILKARYYAKATGMLTVADDSGLEVDALGRQPGVRSARYAGVTGQRPEIDRANNDLLLQNLKDVSAPERTARFVCAMALVAPLGNDPDHPHPLNPAVDLHPHGPVLALVRGVIEGRIIGPDDHPRGDHGFGYDPLFIVPDLGKTTAELTPQHKNTISHRGQAARSIWQRIQKLGLDSRNP